MSFRYSCVIISSEYFFSTISADFWPYSFIDFKFLMHNSMPSCNASELRASTKKPFTACSTQSLHPVAFVITSGRPEAAASRATLGNPHDKKALQIQTPDGSNLSSLSEEALPDREYRYL